MFFYSNPSNLESIGNKESYIRGYYDTGLSNLNRSYTGIHLNNIQKLIKTPAGSFDIEFLKYLFLNQYKILVSSKKLIKSCIILFLRILLSSKIIKSIIILNY